MVRHELAPGDPRAAVSMDIVARQMSTASFDIRPANDVEVLGIATATCLLAFFLFYTLYVGLRMSACVSSAKSYAIDAFHVTKTSSKRGIFPRSVRERPTIPLSWPRTIYHGQHEESQTPYFTCSARNTRIKRPGGASIITKQYYHTQIPARGKPWSRKPLLMSNSMINSNRRKEMTLDMEEGLSLRPSTAAAVADKYDKTIPPDEITSTRESKAKENRGHFDRSFLRRHTTSL